MTAATTLAMPADASVQAVAQAYAAADMAAAFMAIDIHARASLEHALCTVNRYDAEAMRVVRLHSSNPQAYPPGGSKDKRGTPWGRHVLLEQRIFVGEGVEAIREFFDDHNAIQDLGLQSVINIPVVYDRECLGTVNFLMTRAKISEADIDSARLAGVLALPAFLALRQSAEKSPI